MKSVVRWISIFILLFTCPIPVFQEGYYIPFKDIEGEPYVKVEDIKHLFNFSYEKSKNNYIIINKNEKSIKNLIKKVSESVVAIVGENKKLKIDDYFYSKIPAGFTFGSGVIVSEDGRIITNNHVVADMKTIYVILSNKKAYKAQLLYKNKDIDLALLKINKKGLKPIEFEKMENINPGDEVIAIGTPLYLGWANSVSRGIISGLNRPVNEVYTFLQTDAHLNPGNSGGPLINTEGKLVGINTLGLDWVSGISFSIPVDNVKYFLEQYDKYGKIRRPYIGLELEESWLATVGLPSNEGLKVIDIKDDCIINKDKIQEGDFLEAIDGINVTSLIGFNEVLKNKSPGQEVEFTFSRNSKKFTIKAILKEYPEEIK